MRRALITGITLLSLVGCASQSGGWKAMPSQWFSSSSRSSSSYSAHTVAADTSAMNGWLRYQHPDFEIRYPSSLLDTDVRPRSYYLLPPNPDFTVLKRLEMSKSHSAGSRYSGESIQGLIQISVATSSGAVSSCFAVPSTLSGTDVTINGSPFVKYEWSDIGLGNRIGVRVFSALQKNSCYRIEIIGSGFVITMDPNIDQKTASEEAVRYGLPFSAYDVFAVLTPVAGTFRFSSGSIDTQEE